MVELPRAFPLSVLPYPEILQSTFFLFYHPRQYLWMVHNCGDNRRWERLPIFFKIKKNQGNVSTICLQILGQIIWFCLTLWPRVMIEYSYKRAGVICFNLPTFMPKFWKIFFSIFIVSYAIIFLNFHNFGANVDKLIHTYHPLIMS